MSKLISIVLFILSISHCYADHFKGGSITWRPVSSTSMADPVQLIITIRGAWSLDRFPCNETDMNNNAVLADMTNLTIPDIHCVSTTTNCSYSGFTNITQQFYCSDFSIFDNYAYGSFYVKQNLTMNSTIEIASRGASWAVEPNVNSWSLVSRINLTPVSNKINSAPVTGSLPVVQNEAGRISVIQILAADWDSDHVVRCRWAVQTPIDECGDACYNLPNASINAEDCSVTWRAVLRPEDLAAGLNTSSYIVTVAAEDFVNESSTIPLSTTPHQLIVKVITPPTERCSTNPAIYSAPRRNLACYAWGANSVLNFTIWARVYCLNHTIVDMITSFPLRIMKNSLIQRSNYTWSITYSWSSTSDQIGIQPLCFAAVDNFGMTSGQYCLAIVIGGANTNIYAPTFVQGTASPLGTIMQTHTRFSIQTTSNVRRPTKNSTLIRIYRDNGALVHTIDCKYSPDIFFLNTTIVFYIRNPTWVPGLSYYVTATEGVATGDRYCGVESGSFGGGYWRFTIWSSVRSSTMTVTTTTTSVTVGTVTTRTISTTAANTLSTTTGVPFATTLFTTTTTTSATTETTTTTSTATTSTTTTTTSSVYIPDSIVIYPKDLESSCSQPVIIATFLTTMITLPVHLVGMITMFVKMKRFFDADNLTTRSNRRAVTGKTTMRPEEGEALV